MTKLPYGILLATFLPIGCIVTGASSTERGSSERTVSPILVPDASGMPASDAGMPSLVDGGIDWPEDLRPLATLEGSALLAAHAALQALLESFPKEYASDCSYSAKAMDVAVGQSSGLYFVEITRRLERCGWASPGFNPSPHWFELYAVTPEGKVLARYPYHP
ncbi:hypothetical protein LY474_03200 [Myxococcus stipitatus]|uniref:hypothetical protein n=1 Tax=Myxococcus stipitatus TaxID=83455 RepID=UPI001F44EB53|nr:hypothetical protein [Myxococcus stipitatus]MCE9666811.1 hypothetical protein [Myxococcus stipitatus]